MRPRVAVPQDPLGMSLRMQEPAESPQGVSTGRVDHISHDACAVARVLLSIPMVRQASPPPSVTSFWCQWPGQLPSGPIGRGVGGEGGGGEAAVLSSGLYGVAGPGGGLTMLSVSLDPAEAPIGVATAPGADVPHAVRTARGTRKARVLAYEAMIVSPLRRAGRANRVLPRLVDSSIALALLEFLGRPLCPVLE